MKPIRIGLSGKMASGKSLIATYLVDTYGFVELSFASKIKILAKELGLLRSKYLKDRKRLVEVGEKLREIDPSIWIDTLLLEINPAIDIVISDVRFPNEHETLKRLGFTMVRMYASYGARRTYIADAHPDMPLILMEDASERALDGHPFDYTIRNDTNDTMAQVYAQVDAMMKELNRGR